MVDLERLARVADEELALRRDASLVDTEDPELAAEGVVDDLEDVRDGVLGRVRARPLTGVMAAPSPLRKGGGLPSDGFGMRRVMISTSSRTPAPVVAET
jgi:hypothetical protein